jgi:hypothetical protein|tara:strand:- start:642 stop:770 length:129 start_codon:yes stop_codon:yes gene_type:complete
LFGNWKEHSVKLAEIIKNNGNAEGEQRCHFIKQKLRFIELLF